MAHKQRKKKKKCKVPNNTHIEVHKRQAITCERVEHAEVAVYGSFMSQASYSMEIQAFHNPPA